MTAQNTTNSRSLLSSVQLKLVDAWKSQQEIERKRQRLGRIRLPTLWFRLVWLLIFMLRITLFFFLSGLSVGYWFISSPVLESTRSAYNLPAPQSLLGISGFISFGAAVYGFQLVQMTLVSIKRRRLAFAPRQPTMRSIASNAQTKRPISALHSSWVRSRRAYRSIFGPRGLMGIEHPYFLQFLMVREVAEILSQGYQAYTSSTMVPRRWINNLATTLLVLNCWSTLLVQVFGPKSLILRRVLCLAIDTVLDFGWTVVIPVCISLPYIRAYDTTLRAYPDHLLADYSWQLSWQMDIQQLCITSWLDFLSSTLPCASMLASSRSIAGLLDEKQTLVHPERALPPLSKREALRRIDAASNFASVGTVQSPAAAQMPEPSSTPNAPRRHKSSRIEIDNHLLAFFFVGVGVICVHAYATLVANTVSLDAGCLVQMRPWFTRSYACAYANINCRASRSGDPSEEAAHSVSDETEIETRLSAFHSSTLLYLVISHCSALKVPAIVHSFPKLQQLEIYNSTIVEWQTATAFTIRSHPSLRRVGLIRTNLTTLPDALMQDAPFVFVHLIATNLTTLPDAVRTNWRALQYFNMEHGQLREIPRAIASMDGLERLSLCDNKIDALPDALPGGYSVLNLARNPLRALPQTMRGPSSRLRFISFEHTLVSTVPPWLAAAMAVRTSLSVFGAISPFCDQVSPASPSSAAATGVECTQPSKRVDGHYLLALVSQLLASP